MNIQIASSLTLQVQVLFFAMLDQLSWGGSFESLGELPCMLPLHLAMSGKEKGGRKFIVLESEGCLEVVIGPPLGDGEYFHRQLLWAAEKSNAQGMIVGGGYVTAVHKEKDGKVVDLDSWVIEFSGKSVDFGVYTPKLIFSRENLQRYLEHPSVTTEVRFSWNG